MKSKMQKYSRKNKSSRKNKKTKKNIKHYSRNNIRNKVNKMRGGTHWEKRCIICLGKFLWSKETTDVFNEDAKKLFNDIKDTGANNNVNVSIKSPVELDSDIPPVSLDSDTVCELSCGHIFHRDCILGWVNSGNSKSNECPLCSAPFTLHTIFPVGGSEINENYFINYFKPLVFLNMDELKKKEYLHPDIDTTMKNICDALKTNKSIKTIVFKNLWLYNRYNKENQRKYINFIVDILKGNTTITKVNLDKNGIGDDGAAALADALKENTSITELNVGNNYIGDAGVTALAEALKMNKTLTTLSIPSESIRSDITNVGAIALAEALKNNRTLRTLNISNNSIDAVGAAALAEALKQNKTLEELDISYNNKFIYKPESGDGIAIALADALKVNRTLKKLKIEFIGLTVEGLEVLKEAVKSNDSIIIIISEMVKNFDETIKTEIDKLVRTSGSKFKKY